MYYSNGNYEAFARPRKPKGVDEKSAHLVGGGIASLAAAAFLIRDGKILTRHGERAALIDNNVGAFYLTHTDSPTRWQILKVIVGALDEMLGVFERENRPFLYGLDRNGKLWPKKLYQPRLAPPYFSEAKRPLPCGAAGRMRRQAAAASEFTAGPTGLGIT